MNTEQEKAVKALKKLAKNWPKGIGYFMTNCYECNALWGEWRTCNA